MENMKVIIIGAGAAGLFAGCALRQKGIQAVLLERNDKPGRKLYITGKGRCNFT
ncbi:MAG: FAD-dependent oxidoreductase, partial [Christensenellales bacterium]